MQSFDLFTAEERIQWVLDAKAMLSDKLREVEAYGHEVEVPYKDIVHDNAVSSLRARLQWLDRVLRRVNRGEPADAA